MKTVLFVIIAFFTMSFNVGDIRVKLFAIKNQSWISYNGHHPLHDWTATNRDVNCVITLNQANRLVETVAVSARVMAFDSRNSNRDSHALEVLDALVYPKINFVGNKIIQNGNNLLISGKLNFHGVTQPITVKATIKYIEKGIKIAGEIPIQLETYKVHRPRLLAFKISNNLNIKFQVEFADN
jgi:polyisoprenoid-binding protein YceI